MGIVSNIKKFVGFSDDPLAENAFGYEYGEGSSDYQEAHSEPPAAPVQPEAPTPTHRERFADRSNSTDKPERTSERTRGNETMSNVIDMRGAAGQKTKVLLMEPVTFEEMPRAVSALKDRQSVVLNLTRMQPDVAQRSVDFVAGATYSMDGHQERIGDSIFLFAPPSVEVITQSTATDSDPVLGVNSRPPASWEDSSPRFAQAQF
ncbi:MAG: cell division protein SepF [Pseudanabaenaceae cyanobacterium bins.68]|nr:cell division protein SepF [Pseudanabaenaceae cyanobacterium bins.68]